RPRCLAASSLASRASRHRRRSPPRSRRSSRSRPRESGGRPAGACRRTGSTAYPAARARRRARRRRAPSGWARCGSRAPRAGRENRRREWSAGARSEPADHSRREQDEKTDGENGQPARCARQAGHGDAERAALADTRDQCFHYPGQGDRDRQDDGRLKNGRELAGETAGQHVRLARHLDRHVERHHAAPQQRRQAYGLEKRRQRAGPSRPPIEHGHHGPAEREHGDQCDGESEGGPQQVLHRGHAIVGATVPPRSFFYGWIVLGAAALITCMGMGTLFSLGIFLKPIEESMGWSRTGISTIALLNWIFMGVGSFLWGTLSDRFGTRTVVLAGGALLGLGLVLSSQVQALWQ